MFNTNSVIKGSMLLGEALNCFYKSHDYGEEGGIYSNWAWFKIGFISFPLPNIAQRKVNTYKHDINHIITGYETTWKGEFEITAWEMGSGGWGNNYIINLITLQAMGLGFLFYPKLTLKAFKRGFTMRNAHTINIPKEEFLSYTIDDVKRMLSGHDRVDRNTYFWIFIAIFIAILPVLFLFILLTIII